MIVVALKNVPVTVKVKFGEPVVLHGAEILAIVGTGFSTSNALLVPVCVLDVLVTVMVRFPVLLIFTTFPDNTPATNAALVPPPVVSVPVEVRLTVPVKLFVPLLQVLF